MVKKVISWLFVLCSISLVLSIVSPSFGKGPDKPFKPVVSKAKPSGNISFTIGKRAWLSKGDSDWNIGELGIHSKHFLSSGSVEDDNLIMTNGHWEVYGGAPYSAPISGLKSTYVFKWDSIKVGARGDMPVSGRLSLKASLFVIPWTYYRGEGIWNLRTDFRQDPSFKQLLLPLSTRQPFRDTV